MRQAPAGSPIQTTRSASGTHRPVIFQAPLGDRGLPHAVAPAGLDGIHVERGHLHPLRPPKTPGPPGRQSGRGRGAHAQP